MAILAALVFASPLSAQNAVTDESAAPERGWYIGIEGGLPFGVSTFSSFGHDKTHLGWTGGLYGGYRFNPALVASARCPGTKYRLRLDNESLLSIAEAKLL